MADFMIKRTRLTTMEVTELPADAETCKMISTFNTYLTPGEVYYALREGQVIHTSLSKFERA